MEGFRGLLADIDALFGAEIARQEDEAADDLAISLRADRQLSEALTQGSFEVLLEDRSLPVESVGRDFVECDGWLVPFGRFHFVAIHGKPARSTESGFVERLRSLARANRALEVALDRHSLEGSVTSVAADHLVITSRTGPSVVPLGSIRWVRFSPEDSTGVS